MQGYSLKAGVGLISHIIAGDYLFQGQIGLGTISFEFETTRASMETASDGTVLVSFMSGNSGKIAIEMQQTSSLHSYLVGLANDIDTALTTGNVGIALAGVLSYKSPTGNFYQATGVTIEKKAGESYKGQGQNVTWTLLATNLIKE